MADSVPDLPPPPPPRRRSNSCRRSNPPPPLPPRDSEPHQTFDQRRQSDPPNLSQPPLLMKRLPLPPLPAPRPSLRKLPTTPTQIERPPLLPRHSRANSLSALPTSPRSPTQVIKEQKYGGYDFNFAEVVPEHFLCLTVCTKVLRIPQLTACCGQHFCQSCLQQWFAKHNKVTCPHCREENINYIADKPLKRKIDELKIHCTKFEAGCDWVGELSALSTHLESEKGCGYIEVNCTNKCGKKLYRKDLADHITQYCPLRKYVCQYCEIEGTYQNITEEHYEACKKYPLKCPNDCGASEIPRDELDQHRVKCPLEPAQCPFSETGCDVSLVQRDLQDHMIANTPQHLLLVMNAFQSMKKQSEREIQALQAQSEQQIQAVQEQSEQSIRATQEQAQTDIQKSREEVMSLRRQNEKLNVELRRMETNVSTIVDCLLETCAPGHVTTLQAIHTAIASHQTPHRLSKLGDSVQFTISNLSRYINKEVWCSPFFYYKDCEMQLMVSILDQKASFLIFMYEEPLIWVQEPIKDSETLNVCFEDDDGEGIYDAIIRVPIKKATPDSKDGQTWHSTSLRRDSLTLTVMF